MKKKRKKKPIWKNLYDENWELCHEIVSLRDGHVCQIPTCGHRERLDLDHVFTRGCKLLFFETTNLGFLCKEHHTHKSFRHGGWVDMMVKDICKERDAAWWDWALSQAKLCCPRFSTLMYQEEMNERLKSELAKLKPEGSNV